MVHYHRYENEGVSARILLDARTEHANVDVWMSREDLFRVDDLADEWGAEVLQSMPSNHGFTMTTWGPGFRHEPKKFLYPAQ